MSEAQSLLKGVSASGATVPAELKSSYERTKKSAFGSSQFMKIQMRDSKFVEVLNTTGGLDRIQRELETEEPAVFIWFRSQTLVAILLWVPDAATAKNKTLYSTSKGAINDMVTGPNTKIEHHFGTVKSDFSNSSIQAAKDLNDTTLTYVERELQNLPRQLPKSDLGKSQGYGLIASIKGIPMPDKLKNYSSSSSSSPASYSNNTYPSRNKSHVPKGDAQSRSIASAAAHAINTTSSPSEAAHVAAATPKGTSSATSSSSIASPKASASTATATTPKSADVVSSTPSTFGTQEFEKCSSRGCNGRAAANSEYCVVHVDIYKAKNDTPESTPAAGKHCAVDGCEATRVTRGYCATHANETHPIAQE